MFSASELVNLGTVCFSASELVNLGMFKTYLSLLGLGFAARCLGFCSVHDRVLGFGVFDYDGDVRSHFKTDLCMHKRDDDTAAGSDRTTAVGMNQEP